MESHSAIYTDVHGAQPVQFENDGQSLRVTIKDCNFSGDDFDSLELNSQQIERGSRLFTLNRGTGLCDCSFDIDISVSVVAQNEIHPATLNAHLVLGKPKENGALSDEQLLLTLRFDQQEYRGSGKSGWFESEMNELQARLPNGVFIKTCFTCMFSDYSVYGHGLFGWMLCFQNVREDYLKVKSKDDYFEVMDRFERRVQETFLCPAYQRRPTGTGYRG